MVELLDAKWELSKGRTVKFRIVDDPEQPYTFHPFAHFTRRRGNRPGTRFRVAFARYGEDQTYFEGEMMLLSGGNPLGQGMWVSFWLDDEGTDHPFSGCSGRSGEHPGDLFSVVFVELDDDDHPVNQHKRQRVEAVHRPRGGALARLAGQFCANEMFFQWLSEQVPVGDPPQSRPPSWWRENDHAARWIRWVCGVESRADLDNNERAASRFHERVRIPFRDWCGTSED